MSFQAVEELMKHLQVDSYGRCHNNKPGNVDKVRAAITGSWQGARKMDV